jgi:phospholipid N-methyltransferase
MEKILFLSRFLKSPRTIGSITPSSKRLARKMISEARLNEHSKVVELGAGTGVITKEILANISLNHPLMVFESNESFRKLLMNNESIVLFDDAFKLLSNLDGYRKQIDCIFNGLPLLNFSDDQVNALLHQTQQLLKPGGKLIGFQYTPLLLSKFGMVYSKTNIKFVPLNVPPAYIYVCEK